MFYPRYLPISVYCERFNDSVKAIDHRISSNFWIEGVHVFKVAGMRERQVDLQEIDKWKEKEKKKHRTKA